MQSGGVWACIVCWRAQVGVLRALVEAVAPQVDQVIVVDNAADPALAAALPPGVRYVAMPSNAGTAGAMNRAWEIALGEGAQALACFDQDSVPAAGMVQRLREGLAVAGPRAAAVGPLKVDPRNGKPGRLLMPVRFLRRFARPAGTAPIEVDHLITSGCLIPASAYRAVGPYDEALFLDYVDMEWCVRARGAGLHHYCIPSATLSHTIGDEVVDVGGRTLSLHGPLRSYLLVRNHLLLWRKTSMPRLWLLSDALQVAKKVCGLLLLAPQRAARLREVVRGIGDGLRGRGGAP